MSLATLRTYRVALYSYSATVDAASGIATSQYTKRLSLDADNLWWASRGTIFGRERAPTTSPQDEQLSLWSFAGEVTVEPNDVIVLGSEVYRIQSVMPRTLYRDQKQAYCTQVDDADPAFALANPAPPPP